MHGEQGYSYTSAASETLPCLRGQLSVHSPKNIFDADEFGLQLKLSPDPTIANQHLSR